MSSRIGFDNTYYLTEDRDHRYRLSQETFGWNHERRETFMGRVSAWNEAEAKRNEARVARWADRMVRENPAGPRLSPTNYKRRSGSSI